MTNKGKSVVFFPMPAAIPLLLASDKQCSSYHYLAAALIIVICSRRSIRLVPAQNIEVEEIMWEVIRQLKRNEF